MFGLNFSPRLLAHGARGALVAIVAFLAGAQPAFALSYVMIRDDALADRAAVVVSGEAVAELPGAIDSNGFLQDTRYLIAVERQVKGKNTSGSLVLRLPGADSADRPILHVPGVTRLQPGSRVLLFLQPRDDGTYEPADLALGVFHEVVTEGKRVYVRDLGGAHEASKRINEQFHQPRDAERFELWLVHRANGWQRQADYFTTIDAQVVQSKFVHTFPTIRWFKFDSGITENWFAVEGGQVGMVQDEFALFQTAVSAWRLDPTSRVLYSYAGTTASDTANTGMDGKSSIIWNDPTNYLPLSYDCGSGGTISKGAAYINSVTMELGGKTYKQILEGFVVVQDGAACVLDGHNGKDGEEVMAHELGHTLGLAHSCGDMQFAGSTPCDTPLEFDALMHPAIHADGRGASLRTDEIAAMANIYPGNDPPPPPAPNLTINKAHTGSFTQGQVGATYSITVSNTSTGATSGTVSVIDNLPAGLTATALAGSGWSCVLGTLTCTRSDVLGGSASYPAITLTVTVAGNAPTQVTNTASVTGGGDTTPANNSDSDPATVNPPPPGANLSINKTHTGDFTQGQVGATYTITVSNDATAATAGTVTVVDTLPAGLTATALAGSGWTCVLGSLTCTRGTLLAVNASYPPITLTVTVAGNAPAQVINNASVSGGGDTTPGNNSDSDPTTVNPPANLSITKTHSGNFTQGQAGATYTITVSNSAGSATSGTVTVVDTLPAGLTATALVGSGWTCALGSLTCTRSTALAVGASYPPITLTVSVAANAQAQVTNIATVSGGGDATPGNNTAADPTTVLVPSPPSADLRITKSHSGDFIQGQVGAVYSIMVINGPTAATAGTVTVVDTLPSGLTATAISGSGWTCVLGTLTCTRSDVLAASGNYPPINVTVTVSGTATTPQVNMATVSGGGDETPANNIVNDSTTISGARVSPDLGITKTHTGNFTQGQVGVTYSIVVSNSAAAATSGTVTVVDTLPAGLTATGLVGVGWDCTLQTLTCTRSSVLAAGASYLPITLTATVAGNAPALVTNTATVSGGGDATPGNNIATDPTTVNPPPSPANLGITKTHTGNFSQGQAGATYTITVSNIAGGATSGTVTVVDTLPAGLGVTALTGSGWNCNTTQLRCARNDVLAVGASYPPITLTVNVSINAPAQLINTAAVSGGGDVTPDNNTATDPTTVVGQTQQPPADQVFANGFD